MRKTIVLSGLVLGALLLLTPSQAFSQDKKIEMAKFAPKWEVGDWWEVETFVPDLKAAITGRPKEMKPSLPGYPPLNNGIPEGFKRGAKFRLEVMKLDAHLSELDDKPEKGAKKEKDEKDKEGKGETEPSENYYLVKISTIGVTPARHAEALYAVADLALGEVRYSLGSGKRKTTVKCFGTATLACAANNIFGFPFDWPDMVAALKKEAELKAKSLKMIQKQSSKENKDKSKTFTVTLQEKKKKKGSKSKYAVQQIWDTGRPFWSEYQSSQMNARLLKWKKKNK
ncbi:MAG: hypothetical protein P1V97_00545 [Planctomycetota bacterium]|nr:hypothetical protein [Planctomycetota bacterium]